MLLNYGAEEDFWNPLNYLDIKPVNLKGNQPWIFVGRTDAEDEALILWLPDTKSRLIGKDPDAGQDWGQEEKGMTEDEMGWMASPTRWTLVWVNSGSWWWTGRSGMLQSMGSQRIGHDWATELNWSESRTVKTTIELLLFWNYLLTTYHLQSPLP